MQNQMYVTSTECDQTETENYELHLNCNGSDLIATVKITFTPYGDFSTNCEFLGNLAHTQLFGGLHATHIVLSTLFNAWEQEHETVQDVFANGALLVDPALYN